MADEHGYIKISRKAYDGDPFWTERRVFSRWEAWEDLIQMAAWKHHRRHIKGRVVELERGQLLTSERFLADRWQWSRGKVRRFLELLVEMERIRIADHQTDRAGSVVTLLNYDRYQSAPPQDGPPNGPPTDHQRTTYEPADGPPSGPPTDRLASTENDDVATGYATGDPSSGPQAGRLAAHRRTTGVEKTDQREYKEARYTPSPSPPTRAHVREAAIERLRDYLGEHAGAVDRFAIAADHSATWATAILGLYGPAGTDTQVWQRSPPEDRPALLARALDRYAGESQPYHGKLFRRILEDVVHEQHHDGTPERSHRGGPAANGRATAAGARSVALGAGDPARRSGWIYE